MYGRVIYADQNLYIGGNLLSGVIDFTSDFQVPFSNVDMVGFLGTEQYITRELTRNISFSRHLVGSDPILYLTGDESVGGSMVYNNKNYGFNSGYLTSYTVTASVGGLTQVDTDFVVYENIGHNISGNDPLVTAGIPFTPSISSQIAINATEGETNRITSFEYSIQCERMPQYVMGSLNPRYVVLKKPIPVMLNLTVEIDDYESPDIQSLVCTPYQQNLTVNLNKCDGSTTIQSYSINNAFLISNSINSSLTENSSVKLGYQGYII